VAPEPAPAGFRRRCAGLAMYKLFPPSTWRRPESRARLPRREQPEGVSVQVSVQTDHTPPGPFPALALLASACSPWWLLAWGVPAGRTICWTWRLQQSGAADGPSAYNVARRPTAEPACSVPEIEDDMRSANPSWILVEGSDAATIQRAI